MSNIYQKLLEIQKLSLSPRLDGEADWKGKKHRFASLNSIYECVREPLNNEGLLLLHRISDGVLCTQIVNVEDGESITTMDLLNEAESAQAVCSRQTQMKRYAICDLLGISSTDGKDDSEEHVVTSSSDFDKILEVFNGGRKDAFEVAKSNGFVFTPAQQGVIARLSKIGPKARS